MTVYFSLIDMASNLQSHSFKWMYRIRKSEVKDSSSCLAWK